MKQLFRVAWLVGLLIAWLPPEALAQREYYNWYFGNQAGITFNGLGPTALLDGQVAFLHGVTSISDGAGQFQFASDGAQIWDRNWQLMPGSVSVNAFTASALRQVLAVRQPGSSTRYYVFRSSNWFAYNQFPVVALLRPSLSYAVVDTQVRGGRGGIVANDSLRLPDWPLSGTNDFPHPNTNFTAIRHANGKDLWIVIQTARGQIISYLLTDTGLALRPVISLQTRNLSSLRDGILKASGDGKTLASVTYFNDRQQAYTTLEVASFDPATGEAVSFYTIPDQYRGQITNTSANGWATRFVRVTGLEMSPDGSKLYVDTLGARTILQYNLLAGSPTQVAATRTDLSTGLYLGYGAGDMQLAPDGRIYVSLGNTSWLGRINQPNAAGAAGFTAQAVNLGAARSSSFTLPYATNDLNLPPVVVTGSGSISVRPICAGETLQLASSLSPFVTAAAYAWNFGDPASGPLNTASGQAPAHRYLTSGTYTVTLVVTAASGQQYTTTQKVQVWPRPVVSLGPDQTLCADDTQVLRPGPQAAGSTYRWQDGSTAAELTVRSAGVYKVTVTNPNGCVATDELTVTQTDCADLPNLITPNRDVQNEYFVLRGLRASDWNIEIYNRWGRQIYQKISYDNSWNAAGQPDGVYFYLLCNPATGQKYKGHVEVAR